MITKNRAIGFFVTLAALFLWLFVKSCNGPDAVDDTPLASSEALRVDVANHTVQVDVPGERVVKYLPDGGRATVSISNGGDVIVDVKDAGLTLRPVMGPLITDKLQLAVGAQLGYYKRFEFYAMGVVPAPYAAVLAIGYRLDALHLDNTSIYVAYTTNEDIGAGLLLRF